MKNEHWACPTRHAGRGIKTGDHNVAWNCAVADRHDPRGGPRDCYTCKTAYKAPPKRRQYAPDFHYDCDLMPWEHTPPGRSGALGAHRDGCKVKEGHEAGAGQKCYGCRMMYLGRKDDEVFVGRWMDHPHYACSLSASEHPPARGTGRGHRPGCAVADGHDLGSAKTCSACQVARDSKGKMHGNNVARRYGVPKGRYDEMLREQGNVCAICRKFNPSGKRLAVDHNHQTKKIRGLLCHNCNTAIGHFLDDPILIRAAAKYVEDRAG